VALFIKRGESLFRQRRKEEVFFFEMRRRWGKEGALGEGRGKRNGLTVDLARRGVGQPREVLAGPAQESFVLQFFSLKSFRFEECLKFKNVQIQRYLNFKGLNLNYYF
jgi:hypothetical protein